MSHTYTQLLYHLVWSTKERYHMIHPSFSNDLFAYSIGVFKGLDCIPIAINGMPDHVHILVRIPPKFAVAEIIRNAKVSTTKWVRQSFSIANDFTWQEGYGAFSVSVSNKDAVIKYIQNQKEHHQGRDFKEEFLLMLKQHGVEFEEKYLWK